MKNIVFNTFFVILSIQASAQTFIGTAPLPIPPGAPGSTVGITQSTATVNGVGVLGGCFNIERVEINLSHTFVGDIGILLVAPNGVFLDLSTSNGGGGNNYINTIFSDAAPTFITASAPPYTGTFRPEGRATTLGNPYANTNPLGTFTFANTFSGVNADGNWILYINDYVAADVGTVNSWSITFGGAGSAPTANAGPDVNTCPGQAVNLTATGGGTYSWSTGSSSATTSVNPISTTTYTVTVTSPGCGTDTDEVTVTVRPLPSLSLSSATDLCPGECQTISVNLVGTPPFSFQWRLQPGGPAQTVNTSSNTTSFQVCAPATVGPVQLVVCSLTDAFCTSQ